MEGEIMPFATENAPSDRVGCQRSNCNTLQVQLAKVGTEVPSLEPPHKATLSSEKKGRNKRRKSDAERKDKTLPAIRVSGAFYKAVEDACRCFGVKWSKLATDAVTAHLEKSNSVYNDYRLKVIVIDPELLRELNAWGNNLSQLVKAIHIANTNGDLVDTARLVVELMAIRRFLSNVVPFSLEEYRKGGRQC